MMTGSVEVECLAARIRVFLESAPRTLGLPAEEIRRVLEMGSDRRAGADQGTFEAIATLADRSFGRRRYTQASVDDFYVRAFQGQPGEQRFIGGFDALRLHGYPPSAVGSLPLAVGHRFLGLGNVWREIHDLGSVRLLDAGCGAGVDIGIANCISGGRATIVGVDTRPDLFKYAATACPSALMVVGSAMCLPFAERAFDVVLANGLPPLQRPSTIIKTARQLCAVVVSGGRVACTVLVATPSLLRRLMDEFSDQGQLFVNNLATLATGKPTSEDVQSAFVAAGSEVNLRIGANPYINVTDREETAMLEVVAIPH